MPTADEVEVPKEEQQTTSTSLENAPTIGIEQHSVVRHFRQSRSPASKLTRVAAMQRQVNTDEAEPTCHRPHTGLLTAAERQRSPRRQNEEGGATGSMDPRVAPENSITATQGPTPTVVEGVAAAAIAPTAEE